MREPAYRSVSEDPVREARVADLLPATRTQLRHACESSAVLASAQPRWVGRPRAWLLAGSATMAGLLFSLEGWFAQGHLRPIDELVRAGVWLTGFLFGAFALRSFALSGGGLPPGAFLFASGLVEIGASRVRVWPLSRLHTVEQDGHDITLGLAGHGQLHLRTYRPDLVATLERALEQLARAELAEDPHGIAPHDPLLFERETGAPWHALATSVQPAATSRDRSWGFAALGAVLGLAVGLLATGAKQAASDRLCIAAATPRDLTALSRYVRQGGRFAAQADRAQLALSLQEEEDDALIEYLRSPSARQPAAAAHLLTERALQRATQGDADLLAAIDALSYAAVVHGPSLRASVEPDLFRLRARKAEQWFTPRAPQRSGSECVVWSDPLRYYFLHRTPYTLEAQRLRWRQLLVMASRCQTLGALEAARAMSHTPEQRAAVEQAWSEFFSPRAARVPEPLSEQLDALRAYVAGQPQMPVQAPRVSFLAWSSALDLDEDGATNQASLSTWMPMVEVIGQTAPSKSRRRLIARLREAFSPELLDWMVQPEGPRLRISWLDSSPDQAEQLVEAALTLPGSSIQKVRFRFWPD